MTERSRTWALLLALMVGALLRLAGLGDESLWLDELFTARVVGREDWSGLVSELAGDVHPPLYYAALRLWTGLAGVSDAALRFPSAVAGLVTIGLTASLARRLWGEGAGPAAAWLMAVWPTAVVLEREARSNAVLVAMALTATLLLVQRERRWTPWATAGLAACLLWTHVFGFFVLVGHGLYGVSQVLGQRWTMGRLRRWVLGTGVGALSFVPWTFALARQAERFGEDPWYVAPSADVLGWLVPELAGASGPLVVLLGAGGLALARSRSRGPVLVFAMLLGLVFVPLAVSWGWAPVLRARNVAPLLPLLVAMAGGGLASVRPREAAWAVAAGAVGTVGAVSIGTRLQAEGREQWREAAEALMAQHQPGEPVWVNHAQLWSHYVSGIPLEELESDDTEVLVAAWRSRLWGQRRAWVMIGHESGLAAFDALSQLGEVEQDLELRGARLMQVRLRQWSLSLEGAQVPDPVMLEHGRLSFYWNASATLETAEVPAGLPCRVVMDGRGTGAGGEPARMVVGLGPVGGNMVRGTVDLTSSWDEHTSRARVFPEGTRATIELTFVNDGVATGADGAVQDRNAEFRSLSLRCGSE